ncbi:3-keto-disaccharide hydrolase [Catenovulum adriaticum]|uniref:DUF1080 domain-containing protein n=1 Tax=Catenovulum adriaticum TaxID=2984846 RepID=A0ABY7ASM4_9ALTE|nr:DUF1080 domain-containing protein [Catenovulum sp. TS8]WAJ71772.1 DUF1080 domain-containing protein [Catenovulum sp. TS8]
MKPSINSLILITSLSTNTVLAAQWQSLFNGKDLSGWNASLIKNAQPGDKAEDYFVVKNGVIHVYAGKPHGSQQAFAAITTKQRFKNYHLSLEYKWGEAKFEPRLNLLKDAGLLYHVHGKGKPAWPLSMESQIQQGESGDAYAIGTQMSAWLKPNSLVINPKGTVTYYEYNPYYPVQDFLPIGKPDKITRIKQVNDAEIDGWNTMEIIVREDQAIHIVNGVVNMRIGNFKKWDYQNRHWQPLTEGKILLQAEGAEVFYRNIKIKTLNEVETKY